MPRFEDLRTSADRQTERLDAALDALEAQIDRSKDRAFEVVEEREQAYRASVDRFQGKVDELTGLAEDKRSAVRQKLDNLRVQLALGKADGRDAFLAKRKEFRDSVTRFEREIDGELDALDQAALSSIEDVTADLSRTADQLDAELEAAELQYELEKESVREKLAARKTAIREQFSEFKTDAARKRDKAKRSYQAAEEDFQEGMRRIRKASEFPF
jgi:nitrogenase molybdenum-iron protein alpha/beta subunit